MSMFERILSYWRNNLADSERVGTVPSPDLGRGVVSIDREVLWGGHIPPASVDSLWVEHRKLGKGSREEKADENHRSGTIPVLVYPLLVVRRKEHGVRREEEWHAPFVVPARLTANGVLLAGNEHPLVPRELLAPSDTLDAPVIGKVSVYDDFCSRHPAPVEKADWETVVSLIESLWTTLRGRSFTELETDPVLADFAGLDMSVVELDVDRGGPAARLIALYDLLREEGDPSRTAPLLANLSRLERSAPEWIRPGESETRHLAQMNGAFPLSPSQRTAVVAQQCLPEHETLVINGPPGTGKTTLIQSMVASEMAARALARDEPPVFLVASNNNQAVTNVLEAMQGAGVPPPDHPLAGSALAERWVPELDAFGLYLASQSQAKEAACRDFPFTTSLSFLADSLADWESDEFIDRAARRVLERAQAWREESPAGNTKLARLETVQSWLRGVLEHVSSLLDSLHDAWERLSALEDEQNGATLAQLEEDWASTRSELDEARAARRQAGQRLDDVQTSIEEQTGRELQLWERTEPQGVTERIWPLSRFPSVRRRWRYRVLRAFAEAGVQTDWTPSSSFERPEVESLLASWSKQRRDGFAERKVELETERRRLDEEIKRLEKLESASRHEIERRREAQRNWRERAEKLGIDDQLVEEPDWEHVDGQGIHRPLDTTWRFFIFLLAARYWEADWVRVQLQMREQGKRRNRQDRRSSLARLRRMARLTPVMVGTFHTLPRQVSFFDGSRKQPVPLWSAADFLVVDEAGQASPEVGCTAFALARRALVIGDPYQIEPVHNVPAGIDAANLKRAGLTEHIDYLDNHYGRSHDGNLIRLAQARTRFTMPGSPDPGMFLSEHRRCLPAIISLCNEMVYRGQLNPRRGADAGSSPLPPLGHRDIPSAEIRRIGTSPYNAVEARAIAEWVAENRQMLLDAYPAAEGDLAQVLAVVTPFKAQAREVRGALRRMHVPEYERMTVGTVHKLQGAESPVVIFSTTYPGTHEGTMFFDRGVNMLNVAISRAKDSFLVFGDRRILEPEGSRPSAFLARALTATEAD